MREVYIANAPTHVITLNLAIEHGFLVTIFNIRLFLATESATRRMDIGPCTYVGIGVIVENLRADSQLGLR